MKLLFDGKVPVVELGRCPASTVCITKKRQAPNAPTDGMGFAQLESLAKYPFTDDFIIRWAVLNINDAEIFDIERLRLNIDLSTVIYTT